MPEPAGPPPPAGRAVFPLRPRDGRCVYRLLPLPVPAGFSPFPAGRAVFPKKSQSRPARGGPCGRPSFGFPRASASVFPPSQRLAARGTRGAFISYPGPPPPPRGVLRSTSEPRGRYPWAWPQPIHCGDVPRWACQAHILALAGSTPAPAMEPCSPRYPLYRRPTIRRGPVSGAPDGEAQMASMDRAGRPLTARPAGS